MTENADVQIHRADHGAEHPYFIQRRKTAQDNTLSFEARGVVAYLLSKPDDWTINEAELRKAGGIGRDKMRRILQELIDAGYMTSTIPRVAEGPTKAQFLPKELALHEFPNEPLTEKPLTANPLTANPHLHITDSTESENIELGQPSKSDGLASQFGYTVGDTAWWVDEKDYRVTLHDGKITRFTSKMVEFTYVVDGKEYSTLRKPNSLSRTRPILKRKTTPLQDMIALHLFNIEPNVAVGKQLAIRLKTIEGEIRTSYPTLTALDFKFACAFVGKYIPRDTPKVLAMIGDFYRTKNGTNAQPDTAPSPDMATRSVLLSGRD